MELLGRSSTDLVDLKSVMKGLVYALENELDKVSLERDTNDIEEVMIVEDDKTDEVIC